MPAWLHTRAAPWPGRRCPSLPCGGRAPWRQGCVPGTRAAAWGRARVLAGSGSSCVSLTLCAALVSHASRPGVPSSRRPACSWLLLRLGRMSSVLQVGCRPLCCPIGRRWRHQAFESALRGSAGVGPHRALVCAGGGGWERDPQRRASLSLFSSQD